MCEYRVMSMSFERHIALIPKNFVYCVMPFGGVFYMPLNMSYARDFRFCYGRCECCIDVLRLCCSMCRKCISFVCMRVVIICQVGIQQRNQSARYMEHYVSMSVLLFAIKKWQLHITDTEIHYTPYNVHTIYCIWIESVNIRIMHQL